MINVAHYDSVYEISEEKFLEMKKFTDEFFKRRSDFYMKHHYHPTGEHDLSERVYREYIQEQFKDAKLICTWQKII